jgi:GntR family transcriptional regulator, vanillate catabolism transcriptional regulator
MTRTGAVPVHDRRDDDSQLARAFIGVRELLLRGDFGRGERISELPLVARLGVSRTPIRLALERLAHMGLLDAGATGGFTVREFALSEVLDAIEIRGVLEGTAARLASERLSNDAELEQVRRCCAGMEQLERLTIDSFPAYMDLNEAFHAAIIKLAKSPMLQRSLEQVSQLPFASPSAMVFPTSVLSRSQELFAIANEHHHALVDAIASRQGTRAEHLGREHGFVGRRALELALSDTNALSRVPGGSLINMSLR